MFYSPIGRREGGPSGVQQKALGLLMQRSLCTAFSYEDCRVDTASHKPPSPDSWQCVIQCVMQRPGAVSAS